MGAIGEIDSEVVLIAKAVAELFKFVEELTVSVFENVSVKELVGAIDDDETGKEGAILVDTCSISLATQLCVLSLE